MLKKTMHKPKSSLVSVGQQARSILNRNAPTPTEPVLCPEGLEFRDQGLGLRVIGIRV